MADDKRLPIYGHPPNGRGAWWREKLANGQTFLEQSAGSVDLELKETGFNTSRFDVFRGDQLVVACLAPSALWHFLNAYAEGYCRGSLDASNRLEKRNEDDEFWKTKI